jgi:hypothetical protein
MVRSGGARERPASVRPPRSARACSRARETWRCGGYGLVEFLGFFYFCILFVVECLCHWPRASSSQAADGAPGSDLDGGQRALPRATRIGTAAGADARAHTPPALWRRSDQVQWLRGSLFETPRNCHSGQIPVAKATRVTRSLTCVRTAVRRRLAACSPSFGAAASRHRARRPISLPQLGDPPAPRAALFCGDADAVRFARVLASGKRVAEAACGSMHAPVAYSRDARCAPAEAAVSASHARGARCPAGSACPAVPPAAFSLAVR